MKDLILRYEQDFFDVDFCSNAANLERRLSFDFIEYGRSGRIYDRQDIIAYLLNRKECPNLEIHHFSIKKMCGDIILAHYLSIDPSLNQCTRRSSVWRKEDGLWKLLFHQGTPSNNPSHT